MSNLSFSKELVEALIKYLVSRPYAEVFQLLDAVNREAAPQVNPPPPAPPAPGEVLPVAEEKSNAQESPKA